MKIKWAVIFLNIIIVLLLSWNTVQINSFTYKVYDPVQMNEIYKQMEEQLEQGVNLEKLEEEYNCKIIPFESNEYQKQLSNALSNGELVFDYLDGNTLLAKIVFPPDYNSFDQMKLTIRNTNLFLIVIIGVIFNLAIALIYHFIMKPFDNLKQFAKKIAVGEFEDPLIIEKRNYFGAFTESFDVMRSELKAAKEGEYEANVSKRELVASLSHDIKTPVATIKALCEILLIKLQKSEDKRKVETINEKATMIDSLIGNMFHATLEELQALKVEPKEELSTVVIEMLSEINHYNRITMVNQLPECLVYCDKLRLNQVIDNIIMNSYKYANTPIEVSFKELDEYIQIRIKDFGESIEDIDIPLVCNKFYRGKNAGNHTGSGLGLYLAHQFMGGMQGELLCEKDNGFIAELTLKKV